MTRSPYTRRFFAAMLAADAAWQELWTVPDNGYVYILRDLRVGNRVDVEGTVLFDVVTEGGTKQLILAGGLLPGFGTLGGEMRQELVGGDQLHFYCPTVSATVVGTGYKLKE